VIFMLRAESGKLRATITARDRRRLARIVHRLARAVAVLATTDARRRQGSHDDE